MDIIAPIVLILGGILAISALIVAKRPDAQQLINKLVPFQGIIGVAMLVLGILHLLRSLSGLKYIGRAPIAGASLLVVIGCSVLLGLLFGMPLVAKWIPGESPAEQKVAEFSAKIAGYQVLLGAAGIVGSVAYLIFHMFPRLSM
jgi:hypothetical protein